MARYVTLEPAELRRVIVHYHVMKCAGTTLSAILEREFGDECYHVHRPSPHGVISGDDLIAFLRATPQARAITSHHLRYPVPRDPIADIVDCCPVRRPLDRLESLYNFVSADASQVLHPLTVDGLARFFTNVAERYPDTATDVQTAALGMRDRYRPAGDRELRTAVRRVEESGFLVLVDRFDESMVVAEYLLRGSFPGLLLHYAPQNTSRAVRYSTDEREQRLRKRCGDDVYAMLKARNRLDEALCDAAAAELDRRITFVPAFASRLNEFRARCAALVRDQELLMASS
ncbi:MAG TPA: hypothetical protein VGC72_17250 [Candidatus Elarobacter sp.]|jgi:hypothetical protein